MQDATGQSLDGQRPLTWLYALRTLVKLCLYHESLSLKRLRERTPM
jgi:hypothetical protein